MTSSQITSMSLGPSEKYASNDIPFRVGGRYTTVQPNDNGDARLFESILSNDSRDFGGGDGDEEKEDYDNDEENENDSSSKDPMTSGSRSRRGNAGFGNNNNQNIVYDASGRPVRTQEERQRIENEFKNRHSQTYQFLVQMKSVIGMNIYDMLTDESERRLFQSSEPAIRVNLLRVDDRSKDRYGDNNPLFNGPYSREKNNIKKEPNGMNYEDEEEEEESYLDRLRKQSIDSKRREDFVYKPKLDASRKRLAESLFQGDDEDDGFSNEDGSKTDKGKQESNEKKKKAPLPSNKRVKSVLDVLNDLNQAKDNQRKMEARARSIRDGSTVGVDSIDLEFIDTGIRGVINDQSNKIYLAMGLQDVLSQPSALIRSKITLTPFAQLCGRVYNVNTLIGGRLYVKQTTNVTLNMMAANKSFQFITQKTRYDKQTRAFVLNWEYFSLLFFFF